MNANKQSALGKGGRDGATEFKPCISCGEGTLSERDLRGTSVRYRDLASVKIDQPFVVLVCGACNEMFLNGTQTDRFDEIMEPAYKAERTRQMTLGVKKFIAQRGTTQGATERLLGLSQGYLSKLLHGEREPDVLTFRSVRGLPFLTDAALKDMAIDAGLVHLLPAMTEAAEPRPSAMLELSSTQVRTAVKPVLVVKERLLGLGGGEAKKGRKIDRVGRPSKQYAERLDTSKRGTHAPVRRVAEGESGPWGEVKGFSKPTNKPSRGKNAFSRSAKPGKGVRGKSPPGSPKGAPTSKGR